MTGVSTANLCRKQSIRAPFGLLENIFSGERGSCFFLLAKAGFPCAAEPNRFFSWV